MLRISLFINDITKIKNIKNNHYRTSHFDRIRLDRNSKSNKVSE